MAVRHGCRLVVLAAWFLSAIAISAHAAVRSGEDAGASRLSSRASIYENWSVWRGEEAAMWCSDPGDSERMVGITAAPPRDGERGYHSAIRRTVDGGRSWDLTLITNLSPAEVDPSCAWGSGDTVYAGVMHMLDGGRLHGFDLLRSEDGGLSWDKTAFVHERFFDRPFIVVDRSSSPFRGNVYVVAISTALPGDPAPHAPGEVVIYRSTDGGATFGTPTRIRTSVPPLQGAMATGRPAIDDDGTLVVTWTEYEVFAMRGMFRAQDTDRTEDGFRQGRGIWRIARSMDGGRTFSPSEIIDDSRGLAGASDIMRSEAAGQSPFGTNSISFGKYEVGILVDDASSDGSILHRVGPRLVGGEVAVIYERSLDGGHSWPIKSIVSRPRRNTRISTVSVQTNIQDHIGILYYILLDEDRGSTAAEFALSTDGGQTWTRQRLATIFSPPRDVTNSFGHELRDTIRSLVGDIRVIAYRVPTCNFGLTVDTLGRFKIFVVEGTPGRYTYKMYTIAPHGNSEQGN